MSEARRIRIEKPSINPFCSVKNLALLSCMANASLEVNADSVMTQSYFLKILSPYRVDFLILQRVALKENYADFRTTVLQRRMTRGHNHCSLLLMIDRGRK